MRTHSREEDPITPRDLEVLQYNESRLTPAPTDPNRQADIKHGVVESTSSVQLAILDIDW